MYSVSQNYFGSVLDYLESQGLGRQKVLSAIGLPIRQQERQQERQRVDAKYYNALLKFGQESLQDPLFGFHLGCQIQSADFGVLGYLVESGANLESAINNLLAFDRLVANIGEAQLQITDSTAYLSWEPFQTYSEQVVLRNMCAWLSIARQLLGEGARPYCLRFRFDYEPALLQQLTMFYDFPVYGNAAINCIEFDAVLLQQAFKTNNPSLHQGMAALSQQALQALPQSSQSSVAEQVITWLANASDLSQCNLLQCASLFNMSARTLQRNLLDEGLRFGQLLDQERRHRSQLLIGELRFTDLALQLGFNGQSAFNRAFRRWHGCPPRAFLRQRVANASDRD